MCCVNYPLRLDRVLDMPPQAPTLPPSISRVIVLCSLPSPAKWCTLQGPVGYLITPLSKRYDCVYSYSLLLDSALYMVPQTTTLPPPIGSIIVLCCYPLLLDDILDMAPQADMALQAATLLPSTDGLPMLCGYLLLLDVVLDIAPQAVAFYRGCYA